eukprot:scaffold35107_cov28-Tisochrysis_lutea.AAC.4
MGAPPPAGTCAKAYERLSPPSSSCHPEATMRTGENSVAGVENASAHEPPNGGRFMRSSSVPEPTPDDV